MYSNLRGFHGDCKFLKYLLQLDWIGYIILKEIKKTKTKMHIKILTPQGREDQYQRGCLNGGGQE